MFSLKQTVTDNKKVDILQQSKMNLHPHQSIDQNLKGCVSGVIGKVIYIVSTF